jgi:F-type H+-transporting ATPase subunit delta
MANLSVASRYAKSLLQLAIEQGVLEQVYEDMTLLDELCREHPLLLKTLKSPIITFPKKWAILQALFADRVSPLVLHFFDLVVKKQREVMLSDMASSFLMQYDRYKDIKTAHITTTFPLSNSLINYFQKLVQSIAPCKEVKFVQHIKPAILGGFVLQVDDKQLDESLLTKLYLLEKQCITSGY